MVPALVAGLWFLLMTFSMAYLCARLRRVTLLTWLGATRGQVSVREMAIHLVFFTFALLGAPVMYYATSKVF